MHGQKRKKNYNLAFAFDIADFGFLNSMLLVFPIISMIKLH